jgi:hypothetical protein
MRAIRPAAEETVETKRCLRQYDEPRKKNAMKRNGLLLASALATVVAGCVPSLHPLYTEKDLVFDAALVGVWSEKEDASETWAFEKTGEKAFKLVYTVDGKSGEFEAHLLKLGNTLFLDLYPDGKGLDELNRNDFYKSHLIPGHTFAKVTRIEPSVQMAFLNPDWLKELLEQNPKAIRHEKVSDRIVLTASTKELQEFVLKNVNTKDAFGGEPSDLKRIKSKS